MKVAIRFALPLIVFTALSLHVSAQTERKASPGGGPGGVPQATFFSHRLGTDHAEGVTTLDMNGDGLPDILSGAYWYENPGPQRRRVEAHQYREGGHCGGVCLPTAASGPSM